MNRKIKHRKSKHDNFYSAGETHLFNKQTIEKLTAIIYTKRVA